MRRLPTLATASLLVAFGLACAGDTTVDIPTPPPVPPTPTVPAAPTPPAPAAMTPATTSLHRHDFHSDRFSIEVPFERAEPAELAVVGDSRKSTFQGAWHGGVVSLSVTESTKDSPENRVDDGMVSFVMKQQIQASDVELGRTTVEMPGVGKTAELVHLERDGKRKHVAVFPLDDLTIGFLVVLDRQPVETRTVENMLRSISRDGATPPAPTMAPVPGGSPMVKRGKMSRLEANNQPRSQKPGKPSIINSCYLPTGMCFETSLKRVGEAPFSSEELCTGGDFLLKPCPEEGRIGFCRLEGQQIAYYGPAGSVTTAQEADCTGTHRGEWLGLPEGRPWPSNPR
jgi:hypothetical protein